MSLVPLVRPGANQQKAKMMLISVSNELNAFATFIRHLDVAILSAALHVL